MFFLNTFTGKMVGKNNGEVWVIDNFFVNLGKNRCLICVL